MRARRSAFLLALATACARAPVDCATLGSPTLALGTGATSFEPLVEGAALTWERGTQGGFHVWGSLRAGQIDPGDPSDFSSPRNPTVTFALESPDGIAAGYLEVPRAFEAGPDGAWDLAGEQLRLDVVDPSELTGVDLDLWARVQDACGSDLETHLGVVVVSP